MKHKDLISMHMSLPLENETGRAKIGGEIGVNGYFYKGGQFLPNTQAEPGRWKLGNKWVTSGRALIAPGEFGFQPTPFSISIFGKIRSYTDFNSEGKMVFKDGLQWEGEPMTVDTRITPCIKGVRSTEDFSYGELIDLYEHGARWIDVKPDLTCITSV
jgi:hypothetical protein